MCVCVCVCVCVCMYVRACMFTSHEEYYYVPFKFSLTLISHLPSHQSSEAYLQGNNWQALFYYEEAVVIAEQNKGVRVYMYAVHVCTCNVHACTCMYIVCMQFVSRVHCGLCALHALSSFGRCILGTHR